MISINCIHFDNKTMRCNHHTGRRSNMIFNWRAICREVDGPPNCKYREGHSRPPLEVLHNFVTRSGKTIKEENTALTHDIPVGALVEVLPWDDECIYGRMRLYVVNHTRDCDGTPMYSLGPKNSNSLYECIHGFVEHNLIEIMLK